MAKILNVSSEEADKIINTRKPTGMFICNSDPNWIVAIDNSDGYAWTEQFKITDLKLANDWLKGKFNITDLGDDYYTNYKTSFNNLSIPEVVEKIKKTLGDEIKMLKSLGIIIDETVLKKHKIKDIKTIRKCCECGKEMKEGYCIEGGENYYCSDKCLLKNMTQEEFDELYDDGKGDSYWTTWEDGE